MSSWTIPSASPSAEASQALRRVQDKFVARDANTPTLISNAWTLKQREETIEGRATSLTEAEDALKRIQGLADGLPSIKPVEPRQHMLEVEQLPGTDETES